VVNSILEGHDVPRMDPRLNLGNILELDEEMEMPVEEAARRVTSKDEAEKGNGSGNDRMIRMNSDGNQEHDNKFSLDLGSFLRPKKEHGEGKRMRSREDILHARATGLRKLGKMFMQTGQKAAELDEEGQCSPGDSRRTSEKGNGVPGRNSTSSDERF